MTKFKILKRHVYDGKCGCMECHAQWVENTKDERKRAVARYVAIGSPAKEILARMKLEGKF
jgi:cbb3-type cytochrome oxidase cytochrome c subunit